MRMAVFRGRFRRPAGLGHHMSGNIRKTISTPGQAQQGEGSFMRGFLQQDTMHAGQLAQY